MENRNKKKRVYFQELGIQKQFGSMVNDDARIFFIRKLIKQAKGCK